MEPPKRCEYKLQPDPATGDWKLKLSGDCSDVLKQIEALPARKRAYLKRRIEVEA